MQCKRLATLAVTGIIKSIFALEECEMTLDVVLGSLLGELAGSSLVAHPVFSLSLDEIKLLHCEDGVVACTTA